MSNYLVCLAIIILVLCIAAVLAILDGHPRAFYVLVAVIARVGLAGLAGAALVAAWQKRSGARS